MPESASIRCEVYYSGRVQGVGFRFSARQAARGFAVTGFVRNLPDGRVHLVTEGERGEIERFLAAVADSMAGNIHHSQIVFDAATGEFPTFEVSQ